MREEFIISSYLFAFSFPFPSLDIEKKKKVHRRYCQQQQFLKLLQIEANNLFLREEDLDFEFERNFDSQTRKPYQQIGMEEKRK